MDNKNLINGSSALAPKYKPGTRNVDEELEKLRKQQREKQKQLAHKRTKAKAKLLIGIAAAFTVGVILISRYAAVYNMQKNLTKVKTDIHNVSMENENLKVQLLKASDMQQVEQAARTKLHMVTPDKDKVIYSESTKDYFAKAANENKSDKTKESLVAKIKNILF
nr:cell division protein FtsL [Clostridium rhizosphaerae]